ncbi:MAG: hypothetical protein ACI8PZ_003556 [Myxococcota bacterium]|jgi:hypothetical protein
MTRRSERDLRARLAKVEALHAGATTDGEREAAARARQRLLTRLATLRRDDPVARFVADHVASLAVPPTRAAPPARMPSVREVLGVLAMWESGDLTAASVQAWAELVVDRVDLPDAADHPAAVRAEVALQLAALHRIRLTPTDVPRVRRFVRSDGSSDAWTRWFDLLSEVARRRRRR